MKKLFLALLLIILLLIGVGSYLVNKKSATYVSSFLSKRLGTPVSVSAISAGLRQMDIDGIKIMDPDSPQKTLLEIKRISIDYQILTLFDSTIVIDNIIIDHPLAYIRLYNMNGSDNNWKNFLTRISTQAAAPSPEEAPTYSSSRNFLTHKLVINSLGANLEHSLLGSYTVRLPERKPIVINEIDSGNALKMQQQLSVIVAALMQALSQYQGLGALATGIEKIAFLPVQVTAHMAAEFAKQSADVAKEGASAISSAVEQGVEDVKNFISDLFKK